MTPSRWRSLLLFCCLIVVLAFGLFAASQSDLVRARLLAWTQGILADVLGREVAIEQVKIQPWVGRLELIQLRIAQEKSLKDGVLLSAERIRVGWSWSALLRRQFVLRRVALVHPQLTLPTETAAGAALGGGLHALFQSRGVVARGWTLRVQQARVEGGQATWVQEGETHGSLEGLDADLAWTFAADGTVSTAGSLRLARLRTARADSVRQLEGMSLQAAGSVAALSVRAAEFTVGGATVKVHGSVADLAGTPRMDLVVNVQVPLTSVLRELGSDWRLEGGVAAAGRLQGPWGRGVFHGEGTLRFDRDRDGSEPLRFAVRWEEGRLEAEIPGGSSRTGESFRGSLVLVPATGVFRVQADVRNADLTTLAGLPAEVAAQIGAHLPTETRGRLTARVDLEGKGGDPAALRGHAAVRAEDLSLWGEAPNGRLEAQIRATARRLEVDRFSLLLPGGDVEGRGALTFSNGTWDLPIRATIRDVAALGDGFGLRFLSGRAAFQGRLVGTRDVPALQGRLTWRQARIAGHPLDLVEGDVEIARRTVKSGRLTLRSGRTTAILRGSIEARGATPLRQLNPKRDLALDLSVQVNPAHTADLQHLIPEDVEVQGMFRANGQVSGTLQALNGEIAVAFDAFQTWEERWQSGEALFRLRGGDMTISRIVLRRGSEQLAGEIGMGASGTLRGRLTSTVMDVAKAGSLSGSQLSGRATFRLDFQGTLRDTVTLGQATASALFYRGNPLGPATATFRVEHKAVDLDLAVKEGTHRLRLYVGPPGDRSLRGELTLADADLDLIFRAGDIEMLRAWPARGSGRIRFHGRGPGPVIAGGQADFTDLRLSLEGEVWESSGPVHASWNDSAMTLRQLRLRSAAMEFEVRGSLAKEGGNDLSVTGQLPLRMLAHFLPAVRPTEGFATTNLRLRGDLSTPELSGTLDIQQGRMHLAVLPPEFRELQAKVEVNGTRAQVRDWTARFAGGELRGAAEIGRAGENWDLRTTFQVDNGRAEELLAGLFGGKGEVAGAMNLGGLLTSQGTDASDFWRNLDGDLKLILRDGRIGRYTATAKVLALLNIAQLLEVRGPELSAEGMPFQSLTADIKIARGIARTDNLVLESRAMKMNAVGQVNLVDDTVDMTVAVKPFQNIDRIISKIPIAGWLLTGKEQSLVVAYYRVSGSVRDPQVAPIPLKSVGRTVFGIFRNLLEIPEALIGPLEEQPPQPIKSDEKERS
jgi:autotransporter translocation and assembly factor TamB